MDKKRILDWDLVKCKFHESYWEKIRGFFESENAFQIYEFLKKRSSDGYIITPFSDSTFRVFQEVPLNEIRVIIVGQEPYNHFKGNKPVANGVAMDSRNSNSVQPSLEYFYYGLQNNFPTQKIVQEPSIEKYSRQGVLSVNVCLTGEKGVSSTHLKLKKDEFPTKNLWHKFWQYMFENVFVNTPELVHTPVILMGKAAETIKGFVDPFYFFPMITSHPAAAQKEQDKSWNGDMVFLKANNIIEEYKGKCRAVKWGVEKDYSKEDQTLPF